MEQSVTSLGISYFTERGLFLKKHTITAVLITVALTVSGFNCVPYTQASDTSTLSIIRRIDTKGTGGLIHSRYIDEDGEEVSIETHSSKTRVPAEGLPHSRQAMTPASTILSHRSGIRASPEAAGPLQLSRHWNPTASVKRSSP